MFKKSIAIIKGIDAANLFGYTERLSGEPNRQRADVLCR